MTHDELLQEINTVEHPWWMQDALRAVVQLHKPSPEGRYGDTPICIECSFTETGHYVSYPCRNIYTIEKELK